MTKSFQQGQADGLCGIYSLLNFILQDDVWKSEEPEDAMECVLSAVQAEGLLTPDYVTKGFHAYQIAAIANRVFSNHRMAFRAVELADVSRISEQESAFDLYCRVLLNGGSVIGGPAGRNHWVLVTSSDKGRVILNSADQKRPLKPFDRRQPRYCAREGVAILPVKRPMVELEI